MERASAVHRLLEEAVLADASDIHLKAGAPPTLRISGALQRRPGWGAIAPDQLETFLRELTTPEQIESFQRDKELDLGYEVAGLARFRINASISMGRLVLALRRLPPDPPSLEELDLPLVLSQLVTKPRGLVLVTGPTGSGKTTTLAAMIRHLNESTERRVVTIEDPIEYVHLDRRCSILQRELGADTRAFAIALRQALRQDPDVILVGEMRDLETIHTAITAAETGHLVLSTLHTPGVVQSIDRMVDVFPPHQQQQIRTQLASVLEGVVYQVLLPARQANGRVAAVEVLVANSAVRNLIREGKTHQLPSTMEVGRSVGMQTLEQSLSQLVQEGRVDPETALQAARRPEDLQASW